MAAGGASRESCAAACATIAIETANTWRPVEEAFWVPQPARDAYYNDTTKHAPYAGGGVKYHGRGYIQLTHDYNYARYGYADNPEALLEPGPAADVFGRYWASHGSATYAEPHDWRRCRGSVVGQVVNPPGWERLASIADMLLE